RSTGDPRLILGKGYRLVVLGGYGRTDPLLNKPFYPSGLVVGILTWAPSYFMEVPQYRTWDTWCTGLRARFEPIAASIAARQKLRTWHQLGSVQDYTSGFMALCEQVGYMHKSQRIDRYIGGMKHNIAKDIQLRGVSDFQEILVMAEKLDFFRRPRPGVVLILGPTIMGPPVALPVTRPERVAVSARRMPRACGGFCPSHAGGERRFSARRAGAPLPCFPSSPLPTSFSLSYFTAPLLCFVTKSAAPLPLTPPPLRLSFPPLLRVQQWGGGYGGGGCEWSAAHHLLLSLPATLVAVLGEGGGSLEVKGVAGMDLQHQPPRPPPLLLHPPAAGAA
ncbi:unnamed protein product, partial [Closterium sp. NIES-54]